MPTDDDDAEIAKILPQWTAQVKDYRARVRDLSDRRAGALLQLVAPGHSHPAGRRPHDPQDLTFPEADAPDPRRVFLTSSWRLLWPFSLFVLTLPFSVVVPSPHLR